MTKRRHLDPETLRPALREAYPLPQGDDESIDAYLKRLGK
jgi:hypothetical protein